MLVPYSNHECGTHRKTTKASSSFTAYPAITVQGISRLETLTYTTKIYHNPFMTGQGIPRLKQENIHYQALLQSSQK